MTDARRHMRTLEHRRAFLDERLRDPALSAIKRGFILRERRALIWALALLDPIAAAIDAEAHRMTVANRLLVHDRAARHVVAAGSIDTLDPPRAHGDESPEPPAPSRVVFEQQAP